MLASGLEGMGEGARELDCWPAGRILGMSGMREVAPAAGRAPFA